MRRDGVVVAIDGPAGSGKSTVARRVAGAMGYTLVDTGALYRCVALAARQKGIELTDGDALGRMTSGLELQLRQTPEGLLVFLDGADVSNAIREPDISQAASIVSAHGAVRKALLETQRVLGQHGAVVLEGRDIGSVVFPDAEVKVFLSASDDIRARRRFEELRDRGVAVDFDTTLDEVRQRDQRDSQRAVAPLVKAEDAVEIDTGPMSIQQVVDAIVSLIRARTS